MNILNTFRILRSFCNTNQQESHGTAAAVIPRVDAVHKYLHRFIHQEITSSNASVHLININDSEVFAVLLPSISEPYRTNHEFPSFHRVYKITHWSPAPEYLRSWASNLILDQELQRRSPKHQSTIHTGCFFPSPCALCTCIEMCFYGSDTQRTQKKKQKKKRMTVYPWRIILVISAGGRHMWQAAPVSRASFTRLYIWVLRFLINMKRAVVPVAHVESSACGLD